MTVFEQVKSAIDMKTVAEGYGLHINREMCLCPFHEERTPSAKIYHESFHCFGCGEHHDVIGFTQKLFGLDKPIDAVKNLMLTSVCISTSAQLPPRKKYLNIRSVLLKNVPMKNGRSQRGELSTITYG